LIVLLIRPFTDADLDALHRAHASQGFDYAFPDLRDPIFVSELVLEDDAGQLVMASLARLTCEMYLLMNRGGEKATPAGNPRETLRPQTQGSRLDPRRRLDALLLPPASQSEIATRSKEKPVFVHG
jgi:hypothetical protein